MTDYTKILQQISQTLAEANKNYAKFASDDAATTNIENQPTTHPSGRADSGTQEPVEGAHSQFLDQEVKKQDAGNVSGEGKAVDQMKHQNRESDAPVPPDQGVMETKGKADDKNYEEEETSHPAKTKDEKTASAEAILSRVDTLAKLGSDAITQLWGLCGVSPNQLSPGKQASVAIPRVDLRQVQLQQLQHLQSLDKIAADSLVVSKIATSLAAGRAVGQRVAGVLDWLAKAAMDDEDDDDDDDEAETHEEKAVEEEAKKAEEAGEDEVASQAADAAIAHAASQAAAAEEPSDEEIAQLVAALDAEGATPGKLASDTNGDRLQKWASSPEGRRKLAHLLKIYQLAKSHVKEQAARSR